MTQLELTKKAFSIFNTPVEVVLDDNTIYIDRGNISITNENDNFILQVACYSKGNNIDVPDDVDIVDVAQSKIFLDILAEAMKLFMLNEFEIIKEQFLISQQDSF